jgi:hypothetical protein
MFVRIQLHSSPQSFLVFLLAILTAASPFGAEAQEGLVARSHFGGFVNTFLVEGDQLFAGQTNALEVFDVSGARPRATSFLLFDEEPSALAFAGGRVFVAVADRLDVVVPGASVVGSLGMASQALSVAADGDLAVLALDSGELVVADVSDPASPSQLASLALDARAVALSGTVAVVATGSGLVTLDLAEPAAPRILAQVDSGGQRGLRVLGERAFLFGGFRQGFEVFDVADPASPSLLLEFGNDDSFFALDATAGHVFASGPSGLVVLDVAEVAVPVEVGRLDLPFTTALRLIEGGERLAVAPLGQLRLVDVSDPAAPAFAGGPESPSFPVDHVQHGGELLVAADDGFWRYDLTDPSAPRVAEHRPEFPLGSRIRAAGQIVFWIDRSGRLRCLGPGAGGDTEELGSIELPLAVRPAVAFEVSAPHALVLGFGALVVVDVTDPAAPVVTGQLELPLVGRDLALLESGAHAALALSDFGAGGQVAIVDFSNPAAPQVVASLPVAGRPEALTALGDILQSPPPTPQGALQVLALAEGGQEFFLHRLDVSNPVAPVLTASTGGVGVPKDLAPVAEGRLAVVFASGGGLGSAPAAKAAEAAGSVRILDPAAGPELVSSASVPAPASLASAPADAEAPVVTLSGEKLETSQEVIGSKGFTVFERTRLPELTVGAGAQPRLECPPQPGEEVAIAGLLVCVNEVDSWLFSALTLRGLGTGDEAADVEQAVLRFAGTQVEGRFSGDNGFVSFPVGLTLGVSECLPMELSYRLTEAGRRCAQEETKTFGIAVGAQDVAAEPESFPDGVKSPQQPILTAEVELACVENETRELGFPTVQSAILDSRTEEGDVIGVCPGVFDEQVVVDKEDLVVRSKLGPAVTFLGAEQEIACGRSAPQGLDRVTITADGVQVMGFTIRGARHGVVISGRSALVRGNDIGGNSGDGVRVSGAAPTLATIAANTIGDDESAVGDAEPTKRRNGGNGVSLLGSAAGDSVSGNEIAGNCAQGVDVGGGGLVTLAKNGGGETISGNLILRNLSDGVRIVACAGNVVGGSSQGDGNVIGGNLEDGIEIVGEAADGNQVLGNRIGVDAFGEALANHGHGVHVHGGADETKIGSASDEGGCTAGCNAIALNFGDGVRAEAEVDAAADRSVDTKVIGNFIGVGADGEPLFMTLQDGTQLVGNQNGVNAIHVNGTAIQDNLISGQRGDGVRVFYGDISLNVESEILGNRIGTDMGGAAVLKDAEGKPLGNAGSGISVQGFGEAKIKDNVISGNNLVGARPGGGVLLDEVLSEVKLVKNRIGTDHLGSTALGNGQAGVWIRRGRMSIAMDNVVSGNPIGLLYERIGTDLFAEHQLGPENIIGLDRSRSRKVPNGTGVLVIEDAKPEIETDEVKLKIEKNVISGNAGDGILVLGLVGEKDPVPSKTNLGILDNKIGTLSGLDDFGNEGAAIRLIGARSNIIAGENVIAFNQVGIALTAGSTDNLVVLNSITKNRLDGVQVTDSSRNIIGLTFDNLGNTLEDNGTGEVGDGVSVVRSEDVSIRGNVIQGNHHLPIDLDDDGPTANDEVPVAKADDDPGANGRQNFPRVTFTRDGAKLKVSGTLITLPGEYFVDVYAGECLRQAGSGKLTRFLGTIEVTVPKNRLESFNDKEIQVDAADGVKEIVATATLRSGEDVFGTSEIPPCEDEEEDGLVFKDGFESGDTGTWR